MEPLAEPLAEPELRPEFEASPDDGDGVEDKGNRLVDQAARLVWFADRHGGENNKT